MNMLYTSYIYIYIYVNVELTKLLKLSCMIEIFFSIIIIIIKL